MYRYAKVNEYGEPTVVFKVSQKSTDTTVIEITEDIDDESIINNYFLKSGVWVNRGARPSYLHIWNPALEIWEYDIQAAKNLKKIEISKACRDSIHDGFYSNATGEICKYPFDQTSQMNMSRDLALASVIPDESFEIMCESKSGVWSLVKHTAEQVATVCKDASRFVSEMRRKNSAIQSELLTVTTEQELNSIVW